MKKKTTKTKQSKINKINKIDIKEGAIFDVPRTYKIGVKSGAMASCKSTIEFLEDIVKSEPKKFNNGDELSDFIEGMISTNKMFNNREALDICELVYLEHPEIQDWGLQFNRNLSRFRITKEENSEVSNFGDVLKSKDKLEKQIQELMPEEEEEKEDKSIFPLPSFTSEEKVELAGMLAEKCKITLKDANILLTDMKDVTDKMNAYEKAKESNPNAKIMDYFSQEDAEKMIEVQGIMKDLYGKYKATEDGIEIDDNAEGGIA